MIHTAKSPRLDFLFNHGHTTPPPLPLIFDSKGNFCWEINNYLTQYSGGPNSYGARPSPKTVFSRAETAVAGAECNTVIELKLEHHAA
jgi:hypothetical protein